MWRMADGVVCEQGYSVDWRRRRTNGVGWHIIVRLPDISFSTKARPLPLLPLLPPVLLQIELAAQLHTGAFH